MSKNLSLGAIQVFGNTVAEINQAFLQLQSRADEQRGLRGRALVHDRLRLDNPTVSDDGVALGILQAGTAAATYPLYLGATTPLLASAPGTTYVELHSLLRQQVNFAQTQSVDGRVIIEGWGTESGNGKGVAVTTSAGAVIAEVTWNGNGTGIQVGTFTTTALNTDQAVQIRVKGASSTESLILQSIVFDLRYSVKVV